MAEAAKLCKAKVTLLHVCYSGVGAFAGEASPGTIRAEAAQEKKFCSTFLAKAGEGPPGPGPGRRLGLQDGVPAREIVAFAQDKGYDLIVLGTHGAGEVAWYMGGVADRVATHATVPVLLFRTMQFKPPLLKEIYSQVPGENFPK